MDSDCLTAGSHRSKRTNTIVTLTTNHHHMEDKGGYVSKRAIKKLYEHCHTKEMQKTDIFKIPHIPKLSFANGKCFGDKDYFFCCTFSLSKGSA